MNEHQRKKLARDIWNSGLVKADDCEDLAGYLIEKGWGKVRGITNVVNTPPSESQDALIRETIINSVRTSDVRSYLQ